MQMPVQMQVPPTSVAPTMQQPMAQTYQQPQVPLADPQQQHGGFATVPAQQPQFIPQQQAQQQPIQLSLPLEQQLQQLLHSQPQQPAVVQQPHQTQQQQQPIVQQQHQPVLQQQQQKPMVQQQPQAQPKPIVQQPHADQLTQPQVQVPVVHENQATNQINQEHGNAESVPNNSDNAPKPETHTAGVDAEKQAKGQNSSTQRSQKPRRSNRSGNERIPKLSVTSVDEGSVINCHMENKLKTITFKFDIGDVNPVEIANKLVR